MKRAALHNLGCKVNAYETEAMQQLLEEAGYEIVDFHEKADVYVINTCSVTNIADRKSRQMLHRARRQNPGALLVAAGCYVQAKGPEISKEGIADIILGNNKKQHLISMIEQFQRQKNSPKVLTDWEDINDGVAEYEPLTVTRQAGHTRAFLKIQDGCNQFCSYCIIPYARGRVRSRNADEIITEAGRLADSGCREIVLTGIHISSYGTDAAKPSGQGLLELLQAVSRIEGIARIRLGSLEPGIVTEEFAAALAGMEKICPHFHLSLQSGCDSVLKRMNRRYTSAEYAARCDILRRHFSNPAITTDVITGFPGETEEEFRQTMQFLDNIQLYGMHVFPYSKRAGTKAADMDGQVPEAVKAARGAQLRKLGEQMSERYRETFAGQVKSVLLEDPFLYEGIQYFTGYTKEYVKIAVKSEKDRTNSFATGKITGQLTRDVYLMVEF